jgi:hypothetical protein
MAINPEFPPVEDSPSLLPEEDQPELPRVGEGLLEPAGIPFDEECERVVQPEPAGD